MVLFSSLSPDKFMLPSKPIFLHKLLLHNSPTGPSLWSGREIELLITFYGSTGKYFLTNINLSTGREEGNDTIIISPNILIPNHNDASLFLSGILSALRELHHVTLLNHLCTYQDWVPQINQYLCLQLLAPMTGNVLQQDWGTKLPSTGHLRGPLSSCASYLSTYLPLGIFTGFIFLSLWLG